MDDAPLTTHDLIEAWDSGLRGMLGLCETLSDQQWAAPTPCPGWSVADIVAHTIDVEQTVGGYPRPEHALDLVGLPHARGLGELTEIGVDYRRGRPREQVLDELRAVLPVRRGQLDATPAGAEVVGPFLSTMPLERVLRMRIFDIWVHEQDIRTAIGQG